MGARSFTIRRASLANSTCHANDNGQRTRARGEGSRLDGAACILHVLRRGTVPAAQEVRQSRLPARQSAPADGAARGTVQASTAEDPLRARHLPEWEQTVRAPLHRGAPVQPGHGLLRHRGRALSAQEHSGGGAHFPGARAGRQRRAAHQGGDASLRQPHRVRMPVQVRTHPMT